jgi:hypothetical protein
MANKDRFDAEMCWKILRRVFGHLDRKCHQNVLDTLDQLIFENLLTHFPACPQCLGKYMKCLVQFI